LSAPTRKALLTGRNHHSVAMGSITETVWQTSPMGPFDMWPSGGGGFEYFYGFFGAENNQYYRQ
jgi:hypothetical protein